MTAAGTAEPPVKAHATMNAAPSATESAARFLAEYSGPGDGSEAQPLSWLVSLDDQSLGELIEALASQSPPGPRQRGMLERFLRGLHTRSRTHRRSMSAHVVSQLRALLPTFSEEPALRVLLLQALATDQSAAALECLVEQLIAAPPETSSQVGQVFSPLFQFAGSTCRTLFPRLLEGLQHPQLATTVLDFGNFLFQEGAVGEHPAACRGQQLVELLRATVQRLAMLETPGAGDAYSRETLIALVDQGVGLTAALCATLAFCDYREGIGALFQAAQLRHRRICVEASWALARLGEQAGRDTLIELAAEPVARLRVLTYAEELGLLDAIPEEHQQPAARAEAELTSWLATPQNFGFPPARCELIDSRELYWPGYDDEVTCSLFRFEYPLAADRMYENVGIAGPLAFCLSADLTDLPVEDIYAAYAGWHAQHDEIRQYPESDLAGRLAPEVARFTRRVRDAGYDAVAPRLMGEFFGERVLVGRAARQDACGWFAVDRREVYWFPGAAAPGQIGPREVLLIYQGKQILHAFNP